MTVNHCHITLTRFRAYPFLVSFPNVLLSRRRKKGKRQPTPQTCRKTTGRRKCRQLWRGRFLVVSTGVMGLEW